MADKALSEEVEKLCGPQREGILAISRDGGNDDGQLKTPRGKRVISQVSNSSSRIMTIKRSRLSRSENQDDAMQQESAKNLLKETVPSDALVNAQQV
jgi:hypothetical protein